MGNSGSGHQITTVVDRGPQSWAHSFPRTSSFKVLPDRVPGQRLRLTDNGAILQNGGTLSGVRKPYLEQPQVQRYGGFGHSQDYRIYGSAPCLNRDLHEERPDPRNQLQLQHPQEQQLKRIPYHHPNSGPNSGHYNYNGNDHSAKAHIGRSRKKYKAPPAPPGHGNSAESSSPDSYHYWETSADSSELAAPQRKSRLFKTRNETKRTSLDNGNANGNGMPPNKFAPHPPYKKYPLPGQLQRSVSSPQFQDELMAKLRERRIREPPVGKASDSPGREVKSSIPRKSAATGNPNGPMINGNGRRSVEKAPDGNFKRPMNGHASKDRVCNGKPPPKGQRASKKEDRVGNEAAVKGRNLGREVRSPAQQLNKERTAAKKNAESPQRKFMDKAPVKTFYFGMENGGESAKIINGDCEAVDKFAASLKKAPDSNNSPSESFSSEPTEATSGISLKLRPTLPRKQLDIPRFSPTAAWRLLSALESPVHSEEDDMVPLEDRIPHPNAGHHLMDKSGDSGISGDASPHHLDSTRNSQVAWTPQQDLEETSSDGGLESAPVSPESLATTKFSPRFSLSLPRDERMTNSPYTDKIPSETGISNFSQCGHRSVTNGMKSQKGAVSSSLDENWVLSRSVPNLFNGATHNNKWSDKSSPSIPERDEEFSSVLKPTSFSYLSGGHVMYLPEYSLQSQPSKMSVEIGSNGISSRSCEELAAVDAILPKKQTIRNPKGNKKFAFQSTVRQIERKKIAEKLSKEAEEKERRRLFELEAMKRVEEEFQRKREREKADIRQQLRLYNLTEGGREQPDGAAVVLPSPPAATQVLSEFIQPRRDYRDYTPARNEFDSISHSDLAVKKETVHPSVVYQMPKSTQVYVAPRGNNSGGSDSVDGPPRSGSDDNYRKNFAQGALPHSLVSSDSELSGSRPTSRTKQRSRSASPSGNLTESAAEDEDELEGEEKPPGQIPPKCSIILQPYTRDKCYKPVPFKPFNEKIVQGTM